MKTFGERLKFLRQEKKLTQPELAKALKVSNGTISLWETDLREPLLSSIKSIAVFFEVSSDYLLGLED